MSKIWTVIDHTNGKASPAAWEALGAGLDLAKENGSSVSAVILAQKSGELADLAAAYGAPDVLGIESPLLADFRPEAYATALAQVVKTEAPDVILLANTTRGRDLAAMLSIDLESGVIPDATGLAWQGETILATRPVYSGKMLSKVVCRAKPQIVTLRLRAFPVPPKAEGKTAALRVIAADVAEESQKSKVTGTVAAGGGVSLSEADVIVAGGRGMGNRPALTPPAELKDEKEQEKWRTLQGFALVQELAGMLGGASAVTRAVVDAGYIPYEYQVGQTGKVVSPNLYIACGLSGAIQHLAGMRTSKVIVAINKDKAAPIFQNARFGVVGDLFDVLPALTAALRKRLGK